MGVPLVNCCSFAVTAALGWEWAGTPTVGGWLSTTQELKKMVSSMPTGLRAARTGLGVLSSNWMMNLEVERWEYQGCVMFTYIDNVVGGFGAR